MPSRWSDCCESLSAQVRSDDRLVLVAQDRVDDVERLVERFRDEAFRIDVTTSARGASRGRNAGVAALPPGDRLLHFPNDTTWFPDGSLDAIRSAASEVDAGALTVVDEHGPKFELPDRRHAARPLERVERDRDGPAHPPLACSTSSAASIPTSARARPRRGRPARPPTCCCGCSTGGPTSPSGFGWMPPDVAVGGIADPSGLSAAERRRKLRAYGRGMGRVVVRHPYPWWWRFAFLFGGLAFGLRHRATNAIGDGWWVFLGRAEGMLGRTIGGPTTAVTR